MKRISLCLALLSLVALSAVALTAQTRQRRVFQNPQRPIPRCRRLILQGRRAHPYSAAQRDRLELSRMDNPQRLRAMARRKLLMATLFA